MHPPPPDDCCSVVYAHKIRSTSPGKKREGPTNLAWLFPFLLFQAQEATFFFFFLGVLEDDGWKMNGEETCEQEKYSMPNIKGLNECSETWKWRKTLPVQIKAILCSFLWHNMNQIICRPLFINGDFSFQPFFCCPCLASENRFLFFFFFCTLKKEREW